MARNNIATILFQLGLILIIPGVSYIYSNGVNGKSIESLGTAITELHITVKELTVTMNQLNNSTAILSNEVKHQQSQLDRLEDRVQDNKIQLEGIKIRGK